MANGLPWFPFYPADWLVATGDWPPGAVGAYIRLLCYQWDRGGLPNDLERLRLMCGYSENTWSNTWAILSIKFEAGDDGLLRNPRLADIQQKQREKHEFNVKRSKRAINLRWERHRKNQDTTSSTPRIQNQKIEEGPPLKGPPLPVGLNLDAWKDWIAYRKESRLKAWVASTVKTKTTWLAKKSVKDQRAIIEQSISNGWQGLFEIGRKHEKRLSAPERVAKATGVRL